MAATLKMIGIYRDRSAIWRILGSDGEEVWHETYPSGGPYAGEPVELFQGIKPADRAERKAEAEAKALELGPGHLIQTMRVGNRGGVWIDHARVVAD